MMHKSYDELEISEMGVGDLVHTMLRHFNASERDSSTYAQPTEYYLACERLNVLFAGVTTGAGK